MPKYTAVIADDHEIVRAGVRDLLTRAKTSYEVVAEAGNGLETIAAVKAHRPDLLVLDVTMPLAGGEEVLLEVKRWSPQTRVTVFTAVTSGAVLAGLVDAGAEGLFAKGSAMDAFAEALPMIMQGGKFVSPDLLRLIEQSTTAHSLTQRERQILNMVIAGKTNKEIAQLLNVSPKTVDKHRTSLMAKLEVHSLAELMAKALREGLISSQNPLMS